MMENFDQLAAPGYPIFLGSEFAHPKPEDAFFHVLPVPYEASVSYGGGTGSGPAAILGASWQLEIWDGKSNPSEKGIYTHAPVNVKGKPEKVIDNIAAATKALVKSGGFPIGLGGEHSVTYGIIKGLLDAGISDFGVVQIDAHADLREKYDNEIHSHASVMYLLGQEKYKIAQCGVRALSLEEVNNQIKFQIISFSVEEIRKNNKIKLPENFPKKIYVSFDLDGLDPSVMPATGTPVPGGLGFYDSLQLIENLIKDREVVGFDVVELSPIEGFLAYDFTAATIVYKIMELINLNEKL